MLAFGNLANSIKKCFVGTYRTGLGFIYNSLPDNINLPLRVMQPRNHFNKKSSPLIRSIHFVKTQFLNLKIYNMKKVIYIFIGLFVFYRLWRRFSEIKLRSRHYGVPHHENFVSLLFKKEMVTYKNGGEWVHWKSSENRPGPSTWCRKKAKISDINTILPGSKYGHSM